MKEKIKLEIEKLKSDRDYLMFEYNNGNSLWIGAVAFLLSIFIPIMVSFGNKIVYSVSTALILLALLYISHLFVGKIFLSNREERLKCLNCKLNEKYKSLGIENEL